MTTEVETPVEAIAPKTFIGRKIALKEDTDIMVNNILPAGTTGYVIRHPSHPSNDQSIMYVAFNQSPTGFEDTENSFNWFVDTDCVEFIESPDADGLPVVILKGNLVDDDGVILMDGSVGFVLGENTGSNVLTVAFPKQDFRRFAGFVAGQDDQFVLHHINSDDLVFA